jgi:prevent-host-death family protein
MGAYLGYRWAARARADTAGAFPESGCTLASGAGGPACARLTSLTRLKPVNWQIQEAKARFSEMVDRALKEGPQTVTRHGRPVAVLVPADAYRRLRTRGKSLKALLAAAPLEGVEITRSRDTGRAVDLECT